ncbi:PIN domain-containing protein [Kitasatospora indigofera]|uniref:PIN domain-containing protein n=1 Tax=Kitasatospora indigofera TaxID=67307 RepID=UPI0033BE8CD6
MSTDVSNLYTAFHGDSGQRLLAYLEWANDAAARLTNQLSEKEIERLVFTPRYEQLLAGAADFGASFMQKLTNSLVQLELSQRTAAFEEAVAELDRMIGSRQAPTLTAVFDTSMFIQHPNKLEAIDWVALTGIPTGLINLLVPMVVIDELDRLKEASKPHARWRARETLRVLDRLFPKGDERFAYLNLGEPLSSDLAVSVEVVFDPPQHTRLPIDDDEIVDRALAMQPLVASPMKLFTYDTGQSTRARYAGLDVVKLAVLPEGAEPASR